MKTKSVNPLVIVAVALVALVILGLLIWFFAANVLVNWHAYPKNAEFLNLRGKDLTVQEYETIRKKLPDCEVFWDIPFQGKTYPENAREVVVTQLSDEDVKVLGYFADLEIVHAEGCLDYPQLAKLQSENPETEVRYLVSINGESYYQDAAEVTMNTISDDEIELLQYLPQLTLVQAGDCDDYAQLEKLQSQYPDLQVACSVKLCGEEYTSDTTELTLSGITDKEADDLKYLHKLTKVHLVNPAMTPEKLFDLQSQYPDVAIPWSSEISGVSVSSDIADVEISGVTVDVADMKQKLNYLPNIQSLFLNDCIVDNDAMAALREEKRQDYKVVWTVGCGDLMVRTDATYFMPIKEKIYYFFDEDTVNLRYCEDMICVDLGHMSIHNVDFVRGMPNLKYLILAHTQIKDITPLETCKNLVFLELDWSIVRDYTPLLGCTALEDLNLGKTYADVTPLLEMKWLKHLWILDRSSDVQLRLQEAFEGTETELYLSGSYTVGGGWRQLPNYYAMRDVLGMEYME